MIRSTPDVGIAAHRGPGLVRRPEDPARAPLLEPRLALLRTRLAEGGHQRGLALANFVVVSPDEDADHGRAGDLARIAADRPARLIEGRRDPSHLLGPGGDEVVLVGIARRQPHGPRLAVAADDDPRPHRPDRRRRSPRDLHRLRVELRVVDADPPAPVRPAVGLAPQPVEERQLVLDEVKAFADIRKVQPKLAVLLVVPARTDADLDPAAAHLVDRRDDLREHPRVAERDRRDERPEPDAFGLARKTGEDRPRIRGRPARRSRKALEVVGSEERLEAVRLGAAGDRHLVEVAEALLGLGHQDEAHVPSTAWQPFCNRRPSRPKRSSGLTEWSTK